MRRSITAPLLVLVALGGLVVPARAGSLSGDLSGDATLTPTGTLGVFSQSFTGDGDDTTYGAFTPTSQSMIDFSNPPHILISDGVLSETFAQGTLFGTSSGSGTANGMGIATASVDFVITGGTGLFAGATGEATIHVTITSTGPMTESVIGTFAGSFSVPEPSTLALLAPSVAVGAFVVVRGRRREAMVR